ncbi:viral A-type inclusion protein [Planoprotostelium fungivorum]|uniref:Viral A-type inclusion protein n=1 Tax=Planoprotostelium fungivorum TaxID=1890364 RepID=A0A2P6MUG4_9EUKA|nr:viral A-type inclusion protein [Planoprotostelium fungivorum]
MNSGMNRSTSVPFRNMGSLGNNVQQRSIQNNNTVIPSSRVQNITTTTLNGGTSTAPKSSAAPITPTNENKSNPPGWLKTYDRSTDQRAIFRNNGSPQKMQSAVNMLGSPAKGPQTPSDQVQRDVSPAPQSNNNNIAPTFKTSVPSPLKERPQTPIVNSSPPKNGQSNAIDTSVKTTSVPIPLHKSLSTGSATNNGANIQPQNAIPVPKIVSNAQQQPTNHQDNKINSELMNRLNDLQAQMDKMKGDQDSALRDKDQEIIKLSSKLLNTEEDLQDAMMQITETEKKKEEKVIDLVVDKKSEAERAFNHHEDEMELADAEHRKPAAQQKSIKLHTPYTPMKKRAREQGSTSGGDDSSTTTKKSKSGEKGLLEENQGLKRNIIHLQQRLKDVRRALDGDSEKDRNREKEYKEQIAEVIRTEMRALQRASPKSDTQAMDQSALDKILKDSAEVQRELENNKRDLEAQLTSLVDKSKEIEVERDSAALALQEANRINGELEAREEEGKRIVKELAASLNAKLEEIEKLRSHISNGSRSSSQEKVWRQKYEEIEQQLQKERKERAVEVEGLQSQLSSAAQATQLYQETKIQLEEQEGNVVALFEQNRLLNQKLADVMSKISSQRSTGEKKVSMSQDQGKKDQYSSPVAAVAKNTKDEPSQEKMMDSEEALSLLELMG